MVSQMLHHNRSTLHARKHSQASRFGQRKWQPFQPAYHSQLTATPRSSSNCNNMTINALPSREAASHYDTSMDRRTLLAAVAASTTAMALDPTQPAHAAVASAPARPFCGVLSSTPPWAYSADWKEGVVNYAGFKTWYRILGKPPGKPRKARSLTGEAPRLPVLVLHGGPGMPSRYLETLELLGAVNRPVVFYDQIGCGMSRRASEGKGPGLSRINPQLFIEEIDAIRKELNLQRVHLAGHGWGGLLALAYLAQQSETDRNGVASLTLMSTPAGWNSLIQDRQAKGAALGDDTWAALQREDGSAEWKAAMAAYERAYVCCTQPVSPGCLQISQAGTSASISKAMTGGKMFTSGGVLADWELPSSAASQLAGLPTLMIRGANGEVSEASAQALKEGILQSASVNDLVIPKAGTMVHIDAHEEVLEAMEKHMAGFDALEA